MWNSTILIPPPINSFHAKSIAIDLKAVTLILTNGIKSLNEKLYSALNTEALLLSKCVYRMKLQFRCDKGFKYMEKTNTLLRKFLEFDLISDLKSFYESVPKIYEKDLYLPTKQMLEYVLVRMQGYAQLLKRIGESAVNTAELMNNRLGLGHLWATAAVVLGLVSRIWHICKYLTKKCCLIYNDLLPLRNKLEIVGVEWLEENYEFPPDLTDWLDVNWLYEQTDIVSNFQIDLPLFNLLDESDDEDVQYCYQYKLNDCIIVDDESFMEDDDVKWVDTLKNKQTHSDLEYIVDDSDSDSIEINSTEENQVDFGRNIANDSDGVIKNISDFKNSRVASPSHLDVIDISSVVEDDDDDDDDIGESVPRKEIINTQNNNNKVTRKKKNKKKKNKNRNLVVVQTCHQYNKNSPKKKGKKIAMKASKREGHQLEPRSVKIKKRKS